MGILEKERCNDSDFVKIPPQYFALFYEKSKHLFTKFIPQIR